MNISAIRRVAYENDPNDSYTNIIYQASPVRHETVSLYISNKQHEDFVKEVQTALGDQCVVVDKDEEQ
jgi:hypothetical protein